MHRSTVVRVFQRALLNLGYAESPKIHEPYDKCSNLPSKADCRKILASCALPYHRVTLSSIFKFLSQLFVSVICMNWKQISWGIFFIDWNCSSSAQFEKFNLCKSMEAFTPNATLLRGARGEISKFGILNFLRARRLEIQRFHFWLVVWTCP